MGGIALRHVGLSALVGFTISKCFAKSTHPVTMAALSALYYVADTLREKYLRRQSVFKLLGKHKYDALGLVHAIFTTLVLSYLGQKLSRTKPPYAEIASTLIFSHLSSQLLIKGIQIWNPKKT